MSKEQKHARLISFHFISITVFFFLNVDSPTRIGSLVGLNEEK